MLEATRFLAHLSQIERSPNTCKAYAHDLALYLTFLDEFDFKIDDATNDLLGRFAHWLRSPQASVTAVSEQSVARSRTTVNRSLSAVASFYAYLGSYGEGAIGNLAFTRLMQTAHIFHRANRRLVDNVGSARRKRDGHRIGPRLPVVQKTMKTLTVEQVNTILGACRTYQHRLFFCLAFTTGMRIGQILGLRHEDMDTRSRTIWIRPRDDNENGVRGKIRKPHSIPITRQLARLYEEYMHEEYGHIDSRYVFISLTGKRVGRPLAPSSIYASVRSIQRRTQIYGWTPHTLRHTYVTLQRQAGVPIEIFSNLVTHAHIQTTIETYSHLSADDLREALIRTGAWESPA
ncbi:tyrosine-type recombinase/integrase [Sinomonas atrocyanea]|uniref:tyrosine-type recombinase/integrase n=1 Tax=Sinomonas atrocyanea TaxID=37927 RepID=UPI001470FB85